MNDLNLYNQAWELVTQAEKDKKEGREEEARAKLERAEQMDLSVLETCKTILGENNRFFASILNDLGSIKSRLEKHEEAIELLKKSLDIKINVHGRFHSEVGTGYWELGLAYERWKHYDDAEQFLLKAYEVDSQISGTNNSNVGDECHELGIVNRKRGKLSTALKWFREAEAIRSRVLDKSSHDYQQSWMSIAYALYELGRYKECEQEIAGLLELTRNTLGEDNPYYGFRLLLYAETLAMLDDPRAVEIADEVVRVFSGIKHIPEVSLREVSHVGLNANNAIRELSIMAPYKRLLREGKLHDAENCLKDALDKVEPGNLKFTSLLLTHLVELQRRLKKYGEAKINAEKALEIDKKMCNDDDSLNNLNSKAASLLDVGLVLYDQDKMHDSDEFFLKSEEVDNIVLQREPGMVQAHWRTLSRTAYLVSRGNIHEALEKGRNALKSLDPNIIDYERYAKAYSDLAQLYQNVGQHITAKQLTEDAIKIYKENFPADHPQIAKFLANLGIVLDEMYKPTEAKQKLAEASSLEINPESALHQKLLALETDLEVGKRDGSFKHDLFLSYNERMNKADAEALRDTLKQSGLNVYTFRDRSNSEEERSPETIIEESREVLKNCRALLLIVTGASLTSGYVQDELNTALEKDMLILCWYPEGLRLQKVEVSHLLKAEDEIIENVGRSLLQPQVWNLFGFGNEDKDFTEVAQPLIFRFFATYPEHSEAGHYRHDDHREKIRHLTRYARPIFIDGKGELMFPDTQKRILF